MDDNLLPVIFDLRDDGRLFWKNPPRQHAEKAGLEAGFICKGKGKNKDYWHVRVFGLTFKRSRIVYRMVHGVWPNPSVDHINGDSLDDRPSNLRIATLSQNTASAKRKQSASGLPQGVRRTKQGRFMARITVGGKTKSLGTFESASLAADAYRAGRKEAFHEFA